MKNIGIIILLVGLALGGYSLSMDVGVDIESRYLGAGISTPAMRIANADLISRRQNYMIFSGVLSIVGAILLGFGSLVATQNSPVTEIEEDKPIVVETEDDKPTGVETEYHKPTGAEGILYKNGMYAVGDFHFDKLEEATQFWEEQEVLSRLNNQNTKT